MRPPSGAPPDKTLVLVQWQLGVVRAKTPLSAPKVSYQRT